MIRCRTALYLLHLIALYLSSTKCSLHLPHLVLAGRCWHVKGWIKCIEVPAVQFLLGNAQQFTESLVMDHFSFPQKFDGFAYIVILNNTQNIVIGASGFLLWGDPVSTTYTKI